MPSFQTIARVTVIALIAVAVANRLPATRRLIGTQL